MRKALALLLSVLLLAGLLTGCGGDEEIVGVWEMELDLADFINEELSDAGLSDAMRLSSFAVVMDFEFRSDGTYAVELDHDAFARTVDAMKEEMRTGFARYVEDMIADQGMDVTVDDYFAAAGTTLDEALDGVFDAERLAGVEDEMSNEGSYETRDGKLYLSDGLDRQVDPEVYYTYSIQGDAMSFLSSVGDADEELTEYFPLELKRIG